MPKKYPEEVKDAIYRQMRQGHGLSEIVFRLANDKAGLGYPVEMPKRTCQDHMARLRRERGVPVPSIEPGREYDAALELRREALELSRQELKKLQKVGAASKEPMSTTNIERLSKLTRLLDDIARREAKERKGKAPADDGAPDDPRGDKTSAERRFLASLSKLTDKEPEIPGALD